MDWSNETYVRVYTRDTATWLKLRWQGECLLMQLFRKVDRSGRLDGITDPIDDLALVTRLPEEVVKVGLEKLEKFGVVEINDGILVIPNYIEAQTASKSDKQRQRESRENRRNTAIKNGKGKKTVKLDEILANTSFPDSDPDLIKNKTLKPPKGPSKDFLDWYEFYPNKKARATAYKAWKKLKKQNLLPDLDVLVSAIKKQKSVRLAKKTNGGFVPEWPNPSTWLNGERWLDESEDNTKPKPPPPRNFGMNDWS